METTLVLSFIDAMGKTRNIRIDDPKPDLTPSSVEDAMNNIVSKAIFSGPAFVSAKEAYIITTQTETIFEQEV